MRVFHGWGDRVWWAGDLAFSPDGVLLAGPVGPKGLNVWRTDGSTVPETIALPVQAAMQLTFAGDGEYVYVGHDEVCAVRLSDRRCQQLPPARGPRTYFGVLPGGELVVGEHVSHAEKRLACYPPGGTGRPKWVVTAVGNVYSPPFVLTGGGGFVTVEWDADDAPGARQTRLGGPFIQVTTGGPRLVVRANESGRMLRRSPVLPAYPSWCAFWPASGLLACATRSAIHLHLLDGPPTAEPTIRNHSGRHFTGVAFHPSGRWLAATSNDATVKLYDTETWRVATTYTWNVGRLRSVAFSPDGQLAAVGSDTGKVVVWDVDL